MILGKWNVRNYYFKPCERKRMTNVVNILLRNGWELVTGDLVDGLIYGDEMYGHTGIVEYLNGHEEFQIQIVNKHKNI